MSNGHVREIWIATEGGAPMESRQDARAVPSRGLEGDRYFNGNGTWSEHKPELRELTLIETEQLAWFEGECGVPFPSSQCRRNIVTEGISLNDLVGHRFHVGEIEVEGLRLCEPCKYLQEKIGLTVLPAMVHRSGLNCRILTEGVIRIDDVVGDPA